MFAKGSELSGIWCLESELFMKYLNPSPAFVVLCLEKAQIVIFFPWAELILGFSPTILKKKKEF